MNANHDREEQPSPLPSALNDRMFALLFGDPTQRERTFQELLASHPEHAEVLKAHWNHHVRLARAAVTPSGDAVSGDAEATIPGYRLLGILGEGGMGTVYRAEQLRPVHRLVALKVIKQGMDSKAVLARF